MIKVYKTQCQNCLLSKDAIVSPDRRKELVRGCLKEQTFFVCHKSTMEGESVCCRKFYDEYRDRVQVLQVSSRLGFVEEVDQPNNERLPSYTEMENVRSKPQ